MLIFYTKNADISKIKGFMELKGIFWETTCVFVLCIKKQVFSLILTSLRQGESTFTSVPLLQKKPPKKPSRLGLSIGQSQFNYWFNYLSIN